MLALNCIASQFVIAWLYTFDAESPANRYSYNRFFRYNQYGRKRVSTQGQDYDQFTQT